MRIMYRVSFCMRNVGCLTTLQFDDVLYSHTLRTHTGTRVLFKHTYIYIIRSCAKDAYINVRELHVFEFSRGTYYIIYHVQSYIGVVHVRKVFGTQLGGVAHIIYIYMTRVIAPSSCAGGMLWRRRRRQTRKTRRKKITYTEQQVVYNNII